MATAQQIAQIRALVDEFTNDFYTDTVLSVRIDDAAGNLNIVARDIWVEKAARYSSLVNISEGGSSRSNSDLLKNALLLVARFEDAAPTIASSGVVVSRLRRS